MKTVESLEGQVLLLEAKCREKGSSTNPIEMDKDGSEVPVIAKEEKKVQRSAAPRASASSGGQAAENKVSELQKELREAKQALNDQQAEFEQLLAKQAEEMTAEFERSSSRFQNIEENRTGREDLIAHLKTENEQKSENCERLKRLIVQQDEVVAEQKKVMDRQYQFCYGKHAENAGGSPAKAERGYDTHTEQGCGAFNASNVRERVQATRLDVGAREHNIARTGPGNAKSS